MIKKLALILGLMCAASFAEASTLYMATTGSDTTGVGTQANPYRTLSKCLSLLTTGSNTIVVANGVYTSGFTVDSTLVAGTSWSNYLTIQAQTDFGVRVTQTDAMNMATSKTYFMLMRGIIFDGLYQKSICGASMYFYRCGFKGGATSGNIVNTNIGTNDFGPPGVTDASFEECFFIGYSTGSGRYQAIIYNGTNVVMRRCVFHSENGWSDDNGSGGHTDNPSADMTVYNSRNIAIENCFSIDSMNGFVPNTYTYGQFLVINNSGQPQQTDFLEYYGNMAVKGASYGMWIESAATAISSMTVQDFVVVDSSNAMAMGYGANLNLTLNRFTFLRASDTVTSGYAFNYGSGGTKVMRNGIVSGWTQGMAGSATPITYTDWFNSGSAPGTTGEQTYNPRSNGLTYFTRIEAASNLKTAGLSSGQMGAQIVNQTGTTFTRFGVSGYNVLTSTPLFPLNTTFETAIKNEFCGGYSRGFCAASASAVTLTQYLNAYSTSPYSSSSSSGSGSSGSTQTVTNGVSIDTVTVSSGRLGTFIDLYGLYATTTSVYNECAAAKAVGVGIFSGNHDWWTQIETSSGAAYTYTLMDAMVAVTTGTAAGQCASDMLFEAPIASNWTPSYTATTTLNPITGTQNARTRYANSDMGLLNRYVRNVLGHYPAGTFKAIDTAREPDNPSFWLGSNSTYPAVDEYYHQASTVSIAAKAIDPNITVVCGHIAYPTGQTLQILFGASNYASAYSGHYYLTALLAAHPDITSRCDVWALDYFRGGEGGSTTLLQCISSMTTVLQNAGVTTPRIWVTEYAKEGTNFYVSTNTTNEESLKANDLYQDYAVAFSTGVERIFYQTFSGLDYSLMDANLNPYTVYYCLGNFYNYFNGYSFYQNLDSGSLVGRSWRRGTSIRYELHTTAGSISYSFPTLRYKGHLADIDGNVTTVDGSTLSLYPITTNSLLLNILPPAEMIQGIQFKGIQRPTGATP